MKSVVAPYRGRNVFDPGVALSGYVGGGELTALETI
jgi:hypothetical protein